MPDYKRDDLEEISRGLNKLVNEAEMSDAIQPEIDMEEVKDFISQYSPDSGMIPGNNPGHTIKLFSSVQS